MNILYDHQIFTQQKYGGISRYFYEIIARIAQRENVYLFEGWHVNEYGVERITNLNVLKANKRKCIPKMGRIYKWFNARKFKKYAKRIKYDIYHPTYYSDYSIGNSPFVVTVYDMIHELFPQYFLNETNFLKEKKDIISKADRIIAISQTTKKDLINIYGIDEKKIDVVYLANSLCHAVDKCRIEPEPYILYVGNRKIYKNFIPFLKAFAKSEFSKDVKLLAFGGGGFSGDEMNMIHDLRLEKNVLQLSGNDYILSNLYKYAEAFIYPSEYEGFGLPPLEAMHYKTPVICSNTPSVLEVVADAGLYFNPSSVEDMTRALNEVLSDGRLRDNLIVAGEVRESNFSWERCADETIHVYEKTLNDIL